MKIVIAPDSFKGTLSAMRAAEIMAGVARDELGRHARIVICPVADGGEGTAKTLAGSVGKTVQVAAVDPLGRPLRIQTAVMPDGTVVCDVASCCGLNKLTADERDPMICSTAGLGVAVKSILGMKCQRLIIGLGGSATVDGGAGFLAELGAVFTDAQGRPLQPYGSDLDRTASIDLSGLDERLQELTITAACDVVNPLTGSDGAAEVFGPQKGASPEQCEILQRRLECLAYVYERACGASIRYLPGSGAAGGLGAALALIGAELRMGIDVVLSTIGFSEIIEGADLVVTGEGRFDRQTISGKAVAGLARWCRRQDVPIIAIVGSRDPAITPEDAGLLAVFDASMDRSRDLTASTAEADLEDVCRQVFRFGAWARSWG